MGERQIYAPVKSGTFPGKVSRAVNKGAVDYIGTVPRCCSRVDSCRFPLPWLGKKVSMLVIMVVIKIGTFELVDRFAKNTTCTLNTVNR